MVNVQSIQRIQWKDTKHGRWYGFSRSIRTDERDFTWTPAYRPLDERSTGLNAAGVKILNELINGKGIKYVEFNCFGLVIDIDPAFLVSDYHDEIVQLINNALFDGKAEFDR